MTDRETAVPVEEHHDEHLAHHFDTMEQQFDSSKLGMWLFLATEVLLFGGLFCVYALDLSLHPEAFHWGHRFLDKKLGGLNTLVLISSSLTMALAVRCAQLGQRKRLITFLFLTFLGACGFLVVKFVEYKPKVEHRLLWGTMFDPDPAYVEAHFGGGHEGPTHAEVVTAPQPKPHAAGDVEKGKKIAVETCASCHGADLRGMPRNGLDLVTSPFVASRSDEELLQYLIVGRPPYDPANTTGVSMPPRGGNPLLTNERLLDVVAYLRKIQADEKASPVASRTDVGNGADAVASTVADSGSVASLVVASVDPRWIIPLPSWGPPGLSDAGLATPEEFSRRPPEGAHLFFAIYFLMTGLHGVHVVAGMVVIFWLLVRSIRGDFSPGYFGPVDLGGLYWHLVDLIWIFLFPLLYLIK